MLLDIIRVLDKATGSSTVYAILSERADDFWVKPLEPIFQRAYFGKVKEALDGLGLRQTSDLMEAAFDPITFEPDHTVMHRGLRLIAKDDPSAGTVIGQFDTAILHPLVQRQVESLFPQPKTRMRPTKD